MLGEDFGRNQCMLSMKLEPMSPSMSTQQLDDIFSNIPEPPELASLEELLDMPTDFKLEANTPEIDLDVSEDPMDPWNSVPWTQPLTSVGMDFNFDGPESTNGDNNNMMIQSDAATMDSVVSFFM